MSLGSIEFHSDPSQLLRDFFRTQNYTRVGVLVDENTRQFCYPLVQKVLPEHSLLEIHSGEENKTLASCSTVWSQLTQLSFDRHSLLIVLGGGVLGDLGGFCAATYKRGIHFLLIPTTLLAQVDASVGGKLGIDFEKLKNHIGLFQEPIATLIATDFLKTLPHREIRSGFAEIIKHCLISDTVMWDKIRVKELKQQDWQSLIRHSVEFKATVVKQDPKEIGLRKILNFGHTVGHAAESYYLTHENRLFHGEAIAIGMISESFIAFKKGMISKIELEQVGSYLTKIYGKVALPAETGLILDSILQDKKNKGGKILMAVPKRLGQAVWDVEVNRVEIVNSLEYYASL